MAPISASGWSDANLVVGGHDRDEERAIGHCCAQLVEIDKPLRVDAEPRHAAAFAARAA